MLKEKFQKESRVQILSAYTLKGVKQFRVYSGSTDALLFDDFIEQLCRHCGKWPGDESVLLMDNASFHLSGKVEELCEKAGVGLFMTAHYTTRVNPIEEHFGGTQERCHGKAQGKR